MRRRRRPNAHRKKARPFSPTAEKSAVARRTMPASRSPSRFHSHSQRRPPHRVVSGLQPIRSSPIPLSRNSSDPAIIAVMSGLAAPDHHPSPALAAEVIVDGWPFPLDLPARAPRLKWLHQRPAGGARGSHLPDQLLGLAHFPAMDLVDDDDVDRAGPDVGERALQRRPLHIAAREPAIGICPADSAGRADAEPSGGRSTRLRLTTLYVLVEWDTHSENVREMAKGKVSHFIASTLIFFGIYCLVGARA